MTTSAHIIRLIRAYGEGDDKLFSNVVRAMAADAGAAGKKGVRDQLTGAIDRAEKARAEVNWNAGRVPVPRTPSGKELEGIVRAVRPRLAFGDLFLPQATSERLDEIVAENRRKADLAVAGVTPTRKVLLAGPPGTGKTMTAAVLANALEMPLYTVLLDGLFSKFLGETSAKLRLVFDAMTGFPGVYFFDEIDALAGTRDSSNDVGEARRIVNSLLTYISEDVSDSLVVGATNHPSLIDAAMFRRFDDILHYDLPSREQTETLLKRRLANIDVAGIEWSVVADECAGMSPADVVASADATIRRAVLEGAGIATTAMFVRTLRDRRKGVEEIFRKAPRFLGAALG